MVRGKSIRRKVSQLIVPRLEGRRLTDSTYFEKIKRLVEQGIGGFILFGGKYKDVKKALKELQRISKTPLFIASDLEQGLGQQIEGGTLFPSALAIGSAIDTENKDDIKLLREAIQIMSQEAIEVGINVILAPVLDINTNPENPIICTRAFSDNPGKVTWFGREFIKGIQFLGLIACAKHFPGHGDTERDSHLEIPVIKKPIDTLRRIELRPFADAIKAGVQMIMAGHLRVDAIDPDSPASLSYKVINGFLRKDLGFKRIVITDAMNMGGIKERYNEDEACFLALKAGVDIILHPENPESVIESLLSKWEEIELLVEGSLKRISKAKERFSIMKEGMEGLGSTIDIKAKNKVAETLSKKAIKVIKGIPEFLERSILLILDDDNSGAGNAFTDTLKTKSSSIEVIYIDSDNLSSERLRVLKNVNSKPLIVGIFSKVSAWKGRSGVNQGVYQLLKDALRESYTSTVISFGSPYILDKIEADNLIAAYWGSDYAQRGVGTLLCEKAT
ncbi:MAG: hypothetical protein HZA09_05025 [Nitrospirae bacterium]|nr:hypothetical protein [Nitrospirota bacterium]